MGREHARGSLKRSARFREHKLGDGRVQTWLNTYEALFTAECAEDAEIFNFDFSSAVSAFSAVGSTRPIADARISDNHWLFLAAPDCYRKRSFSKPTKSGL
jgi:hypothetical protein